MVQKSYLRSVIAEPGTLTPAQVTQLADLRRCVVNQLHGSNFEGSGRTAAALFSKTENDFTNTALDQNRQRAITAAGQLAGNQTEADRALMAGAQAGSTAASDIGKLTAEGGLATGKLCGGALGDVASLINRQSKLSQVTA